MQHSQRERRFRQFYDLLQAKALGISPEECRKFVEFLDIQGKTATRHFLKFLDEQGNIERYMQIVLFLLETGNAEVRQCIFELTEIYCDNLNKLHRTLVLVDEYEKADIIPFLLKLAEHSDKSVRSQVCQLLEFFKQNKQVKPVLKKLQEKTLSPVHDSPFPTHSRGRKSREKCGGFTKKLSKI